MRRLPSVACSPLFFLVLLCTNPHRASAVGIAGFDSCGVTSGGAQYSSIDTVDFHPHKVPSDRYPYANRDLDLLWSDRYSSLFGRPLNAVRPPGPDNDLDLLGRTICQTPATGAFGFPIPYIQLVYDYLRAPGFGRPSSVDVYDTNPLAVLGFAVAQPTYGDFDRNHADVYLFAPRFTGDPLWHGGGEYVGDGGNPYPQSPSAFRDAEEDVSSGHPALLDSAHTGNSLSIAGPTPSQVGAPGAGDWTGPRSLAPFVFNHEFQHTVNNLSPDSRLTEILSAAAEALTGMRPDTPRFDVPYTWGLLRLGLNYQAYESIAPYLAYNFRGVDTTFDGRNDDLVWRWARSTDRSLVAGLGQQLLTVNCAECSTATRTYFNGLSATDRVNLLVHNWRVANYANQPALAEGQYGFPPQFGFNPITALGAWQNIDAGAADSANIELEVRLDSDQLTRELTFAGQSTNTLHPANAHAVALAHLGSEYWVVRSDPSLWGSNHDLVIRVMPEGICAVRLFVSAIAYSEQNLPSGQPDSLWKHPEWAQSALAPKWADVVTMVDPLELVVPGFGQTHKAALIVISTGSAYDSGSDAYVLPYRLNLGLRVAPYQNPNPLQVTSYTSPYAASLATWSPDGSQVAFTRADSSAGPDQVCRAPASGGPPTILYAQPFNQFSPDWSPRGDWVSFAQTTAGGGSDIWAVNPTTGQVQQLTTSANAEFAPSFSPNGQHVAYVRAVPLDGHEVRRVAIDGSDDQFLVARPNAVIGEARWSPNGSLAYFIVSGTGAQDSLYSVEALGPAQGTVTAVAQLPQGDVRFDPPRGAGRWLWETTWQPFSCDQNSVTSHRVAVRSSPTSTSETIFGRPLANLGAPRWSWDGTRVAFTASRVIPPASPANIVVGQVTYNHAPSLSGLGDAGLTQGVPFQLQLSATDPDGESLSYECPAVYWPPGASFDPGTHTFSWPNPQPAGAAYYVVFRALDPSGGVSHRVVRYTVQSPDGGCPFVDTRTAAGWQEENSILSRSLTGALALDVYRLKFTPEIAGGRLRVRLRENEQEYTTLDQVRVVAVDRAPEVRSYALGDRLFLGTRDPAFRVTTSTGQDVTALVSGAGNFYQGWPGDTLLVQMTVPTAPGTFAATGTQDGGGGEGGMEGDPKEMQIAQQGIDSPRASPAGASVVDAGVLASTGILVQVPDGTGGWRQLAHYYPRRYRDEAVVDSLGLGPCQLIFVGRHRLHFIGRYLRAATQATPQLLSLLEARHSQLGDVRNAVASNGGATAPLVPGDTLALQFGAAGAIPAGSVRDYFLLSTGVYSAVAPLAQEQQGEPGAAARPTLFALGQNRPNPFSGRTTITFDLPAASRVRLEVFDLQGRCVAVLADGAWPAGYHSLEWDRRDARGLPARPGVYLYRMTAGVFRGQKKLVLFE